MRPTHTTEVYAGHPLIVLAPPINTFTTSKLMLTKHMGSPAQPRRHKVSHHTGKLKNVSITDLSLIHRIINYKNSGQNALSYP